MWFALILALVTTTLGGIITWVVAKRYFERTVDINLTVSIVSGVGLLRDADLDLAGRLKLFYQGVEIDDPYQLHYRVANTSDLPISHCTEPLSLNLPKGIKVVEAKIVRIYPEGRKIDDPEVRVKPDGSQQVRFPFDLLNRRERFLVRLLLDGMVDPRGLNFSIQAPGLPPVIEPEIAPEYIDLWPRFNWKAVAYGLFIFAGGIGSYYGLELFRDTYRAELYHSSWSSIFMTILVLGWATATGITLIMGLFVGLGVGLLPFLTNRHAPNLLSPLFGYGWKGPATGIEIPAPDYQPPGLSEHKDSLDAQPPATGTTHSQPSRAVRPKRKTHVGKKNDDEKKDD
jgi:hypothetical protein